jgi:uncharacterized protein YlzI (FlbEa/FlbD family)
MVRQWDTTWHGVEAGIVKRFVALTGTAGEPWYINPDHIMMFYPTSADIDGPSHVVLADGTKYVVRQSVGEILVKTEALEGTGVVFRAGPSRR